MKCPPLIVTNAGGESLDAGKVAQVSCAVRHASY